MDDVSFVLRLVNAILSGIVVGLCFLKVHFDYEHRARNARIIGLGLLCLATSWGSFALRNQPFKPWIPLVTLSLMFCFYGMRRIAAGESSHREN